MTKEQALKAILDGTIDREAYLAEMKRLNDLGGNSLVRTLTDVDMSLLTKKEIKKYNNFMLSIALDQASDVILSQDDLDLLEEV